MKATTLFVLVMAGRPAEAKRFGMQTLYDDPMIREIYRRGVRDACEWACVHLPPIRQRVMEDWLTDLDLWRGGDPPSPPHSRAGASP